MCQAISHSGVVSQPLVITTDHSGSVLHVGQKMIPLHVLYYCSVDSDYKLTSHLEHACMDMSRCSSAFRPREIQDTNANDPVLLQVLSPQGPEGSRPDIRKKATSVTECMKGRNVVRRRTTLHQIFVHSSMISRILVATV